MDITAPVFESEVLEASRTLPVVADFWAPWCGPCRALTPTLEKVAKDYEGRIKLVKINSDENPELARLFGIRSIPNVIAFKDGKPAAQFMGAIPEAQVRAFFDSLLPTESDLALAKAEALFKQGTLDEAEQELAKVRFDPDTEPKVEALKQGIAAARAAQEGPGEDELKRKLASNPADHAARAQLAQLHVSRKRYRDAMDELLEIVRRDKDWNEGEAKTRLVSLFSLAEDAELVSEYRRKLGAALN